MEMMQITHFYNKFTLKHVQRTSILINSDRNWVRILILKRKSFFIDKRAIPRGRGENNELFSSTLFDYMEIVQYFNFILSLSLSLKKIKDLVNMLVLKTLKMLISNN